jgi:O-6-methylguanine DNA methyltransferase
MKKNNSQTISYYFYELYGQSLLVAEQDGSICFVAFDKNTSPGQLKQHYQGATYVEQETTEIKKAYHYIANKGLGVRPSVLIKGSDFQQTVWQALCDVALGQTVTYKQLAEMIGKPQAYRAVASAVAKNHLAYIVPCHRVVPSGGGTGQYRWGSGLKQRILDAEQK